MAIRTLLSLALVAVLVVSVSADEVQKKKGTKDALARALNSIRDRITSTETMDALRAQEVRDNCTRDNATLADRIVKKQGEIDAKQAQIQTEIDNIARLEGEIAATAAERDAKEAEREKKRQQIVDGDKQRQQEHLLFLNQTADTNVALEALAEVQNLIKESTLEANEGDEAGNFANTTLRATNSDDYANAAANAALITVKTSHLLRKLAAKVTDPNVQSFIQMAALSASALQGDDVSRLNQLLSDLITELNTYKTELAAAEEKARKDWEDLKAALNRDINQLTAAIDSLNAKIRALNLELQTARDNKARYEEEKRVLEGEKADLEAQQAALNKLCVDEEDRYQERRARREEELKTLEAIQKVIEEKLGAMDSKTAVSIDYHGGEGYDWVQGEWGACENRIQQVDLYCIGPDGQRVTEFAELSDKCGKKPAGIRRSCRTADMQNDYFF